MNSLRLSILIFLCLCAVIRFVRSNEPAAADILEMSRIFDFDDVPPANPEEDAPRVPATPRSAAPKSKLPDDLQQQLDSLAATEKALAEKHSAAVVAHRRVLADWLATEHTRTTRPADAAVLEALAKSVRERGVAMGDLRYDLSRLSGAWTRGKDGRVLLPDGTVRAKDKATLSTTHWEWLDYQRGIVAYHWPACGQYCQVGAKSQDDGFMTSLMWGRNKTKRQPLKGVSGTALDQPAPFSTMVQAKLAESARFEQKAKLALAALIKAGRDKVLPQLMSTVQKAPLDVAALAVDELERLKLPANAITGAEKLAGSWKWHDARPLRVSPDGTLRLGDKSGSWKWAGDRGNYFFVIIPLQQCYCCRRSASDPDKIHVMNEAGERSECRRTKP